MRNKSNHSILETYPILFALQFVFLTLFCSSDRPLKNDAGTTDVPHFFLDTSPVRGFEINFSNFDKFVNSARINAFVTKEALKDLQRFCINKNKYRIHIDSVFFDIQLNPFNNYIQDISGTIPERLNYDEILSVFANYKLLNQFIYDRDIIYLSEYNKSVALISSCQKNIQPRSYHDFFIDMYTGRVSEYTFMKYCNFKGYDKIELKGEYAKLKFVKKVLPGLLINKCADIPGYSDSCSLAVDFEKMVSAIRYEKGVYDQSYEIVVAYSYQKLGGKVYRYKFVFHHNFLVNVDVLQIGGGIGDAEYLI